MTEKVVNNTFISLGKTFWPLYLLGGFQSLAYGGIIVLIVPLSSLFWSGEPYHALEMGILITSMVWMSAISGIIIGILIDKYSRKYIMFIISIFRGFSMIMLGFAIEGKGLETWTYFLIFTGIFAFFAGGSWPAIISLSNDIVPHPQRSQFFGLLGIMMSLFTQFGFLVASFLVQYEFWRSFFWGVGVSILVAGIIFLFQIEEPKRGAQQQELNEILNDDSIKYDFHIDKKIMKKTMLSRTNVVALIEGISTNLFLGSLDLLILPYIQTPPHNISPIFTGLFLVIFGLTGGLIGQLFLAKLSDKLAMKKPIRRIYFVIFSLSLGITTFSYLFFLDLPHLTVEQGKDIPYILSLPIMWIMGLLFFTSNSISSLYLVNQAPVLQEINLPEAQGKIASWNQLLESIGYGAGPLLVGILLSISGQNYQLVILIIIIFVIPGIVLWFLSLKWYPKDRDIIKSLLKERAEILKSQKNLKN